MKKILIIAIATSAFLWLLVGLYFLYPSSEPISVLGAPASQATRDLIPDNDSERYVGTTTPSTNAYAGVITDQLCLTGDTCRTTWPGSSSFSYDAWTHPSAGISATTSQMIFNSASSTFTSQLNVSGVLNASSTGLFGTGLTVYSGNSVLAGGATITCTGCLTDVNVADIALGGGTSGNYVRTLADDGQGTVTVTGSGAEDADVTLRVIDLVCTDCIGATEISDVYLLNNADDETTGKLTVAGGLIGQASSTFSQGLIIAGLPFQASSTALFGSGISVTGGTVTFPAGFGGRSTTINGTALDVDAELYTKMFTFAVATSTFSTTTMVSQHKLAVAGTIVRVSCSTNQGTTSVQLDERTEGNEKAAGTNILNNNLGCGSGEDVNAATSFTNAGIAADGIINLQFTGASSTKPTQVFIHVEYTVDD